MKYYILPVEVLTEHGIGDEPWRKRKENKALTNEVEVVGLFGYGSVAEFENETGSKPITLSEAKKWIQKQ